MYVVDVMKQTTDADERAEYVTEKINHALANYDVTAEFDEATIIGSGEDAYIHAIVTFDPQTTAEEVAGVRRALPLMFDREIDFRGSETLALKIQSDL